jgi:DNA polymerase I-like protein with 3'-5' exonuclease and polymerase domains
MSPGLNATEERILPKRKYGPLLKRYFVHKAMNAVIQGSSADMIKKAMVNLYKKGEVPHITIHDELDFLVSRITNMRG